MLGGGEKLVYFPAVWWLSYHMGLDYLPTTLNLPLIPSS